jgi:hypothetical protein
MAKKIFLIFKKGKQKEFLQKAIKFIRSGELLAKQVNIPSSSIYDYKNEIRKIPLYRAKNIAKFAKLDWCKIKEDIIYTIEIDWSKRETDFLNNNYMDMTAREIAEKLNKTINSVKDKRRALKLYKGPKYKWRKEKVIARFQELKIDLSKTPTYEECFKFAPGMLSAIHLIWGKYSMFLREQNLDIHIKYWTKQDCINEFNKIMQYQKNTPTQEDLKCCSGLFRAIVRRWDTYNKFLKTLGHEPNFELRWNKDVCVTEFNKLMKLRTHIPTVEEFREIDYGLLAAIYKYHKTYSRFLKSIGYISYYKIWLQWEQLVERICQSVFDNVVLKPRLINNKLPDVAVLKGKQYIKIIDAKLNSNAYSMYKDIRNYKEHCDELEFWCAYGTKCLKTTKAKIRTINEITQLLVDNNEFKLLNELKEFQKCLAKSYN